MTLHPLAAHFGEVADAYERGRPDYALAVPGAIAAELSVPTGATVLDLAAGTGKLTRALLAAGLNVIAVEPQAPLRAILAGAIGVSRVHDGLAEAIPLPPGSVAAVTVADGFHGLIRRRRWPRSAGSFAPAADWPSLTPCPIGVRRPGRTRSARCSPACGPSILISTGRRGRPRSTTPGVGASRGRSR